MKHYPSISSSLDSAWNKYEDNLSRSRSNLSVDNVHDLRVSTQRLEAILCLSRILTKSKKLSRLLKNLKKTRCSLGPLRDIQVEMLELNEMKFSSKDTKEYFFYCDNRKKIAQKKALRAIKRNTPHSHAKIFEREKKKVNAIEKTVSHHVIKEKLEANLRNYFFPLNRKLRNHSIQKRKGLHKYRILTKQLRYQGEAMKELLGSTMFNMKDLKGTQAELGKIQDNSNIIKNLNTFLSSQKRLKQPGLEAIRDQIQLTHEKLVQLELQALSTQQWKNSA